MQLASGYDVSNVNLGQGLEQLAEGMIQLSVGLRAIYILLEDVKRQQARRP
jgi:hypothetical protein